MSEAGAARGSPADRAGAVAVAARLTLLLSTVPWAGCATDAPGASAPVIRDSAGIRIVENRGAAGATETRWRVGPTPILEIGVIEGPPEYQLYRTRDVVALSDGTIVVANGGTHEVRFYDADGRFLRAAGREGGGPGEFRDVTTVDRFGGDSLVVFDRRARRVSIFSPDGDFVRAFTPEPAGDRRPRILGALEDGTLVGRTRIGAQPDARDVKRDTIVVHTFERDGTVRATAGHFPEGEEEEHVARSGDLFRVSTRTLPFSRGAFVALGARRVFAASSDRYEIGVYGADGALDALIRRVDIEPRLVTEEVMGRYIDAYIEVLPEVTRVGTPRPPGEVRERLETSAHAPRVPTFLGFRVAVDGALWVRDYPLPWAPDDAPAWTIFGPDGRMIARVRTPAGFTVRHITRDRIIGTVRDRLDVEYVRIHELIKPERGP